MIDPVDSLTRRRFLEFGGGGLLSLNLGGLWQAQASTPSTPTVRSIRSCILIFCYGGPSQLDTFDLKPNAPEQVRGEFRPISTSVPGLTVCEHLPRLAGLMHHAALVRTVTHRATLHDSASIHVLTGRPLDGPDRELFSPLPQFYPSLGGAVAYMHRARNLDVPFAALPFAFRNVVETPCQGGGFLGSSFDPLRIESIPAMRQYQIEMLQPSEGVGPARLRERRRLLEDLERQSPPGAETASRRAMCERAYRLLDSQEIRRAVDITQEPMQVRERYGFGADPALQGEGGGGGNGAELGAGRQMRGQNLLLARRLVEAGVPFINVYDFKQQGQNWDAHFRCFNQHKTHLLPQLDQSLSALLEDLDVRGLLESTLVVVMGEFGRTPRINGDGGRDHWPSCFTVFLAGGGVRGGAIHGVSDRLGAYPEVDPVTPADLAATIFWRFGIDPATEIHDQTGRPHRLAAGEPLVRLFGA